MSLSPELLIILGCGGHARSVADAALSSGTRALAFVDACARPDETILGFPVHSAIPDYAMHTWKFVPGAGDNHRRYQQLLDIQNAGLPLGSVIAATASIGLGATVSPGCFVGHHAHIGPLTKLGGGCLINTGAVVEHDCQLGVCVHISVNATVAGRCSVGNYSFVGAGAVLIDGIDIADNVTIGGGGVVVAAIEAPGTYVGVPAKRV